MFINSFQQVINPGDFVVYQTKWGGPAIRLVREIMNPNGPRSAAKVLTFYRMPKINREIGRFAGEYEIRICKSRIHKLQYAMPIYVLPDNMHPDLRVAALLEQRKIRELGND